MKAYNLGLYEKAMPSDLSWKEKLTEAGKAGFDFLEISIDETHERLCRLNMSQEERREITQAIEETGIPIGSMCLSGHRKYPFGSNEKECRKRSMEIMEKAIYLAEKLGIRTIQLAGYDVYYEISTPETIKQFEENLKKAVDMAAKAGIMMGFETMETPFMDTVKKAMNYVNKVNSAYLNIYPDSGNIMNAALIYGTDVTEDIRSGAGHLVAFHLKEAAPGKYREVPFTTGQVDFSSIICEAWKLGVRRYVTEFWYVGSPNWREDLIFAQQVMSEILDKQGELPIRVV